MMVTMMMMMTTVVVVVAAAIVVVDDDDDEGVADVAALVVHLFHCKIISILITVLFYVRR